MNKAELVNRLRKRRRFPIKVENEHTYLTVKEVAVLKRLTSGERAKEIAFSMGASLHTVNTHLANIKEKLRCDNIFQLGFTLGKTLPTISHLIAASDKN